MTGDALKKFKQVMLEDVIQKGVNPALFDHATKQWVVIVWAKLSDGQGNEGVGIAAFDSQGCLVESDVWSVNKFFELMEKAFGVDA
jgi:hypothetical protein